MLTELRNSYRDFGLLLLRIGVGIMFILIGYPKLFGGPDEWELVGGDAAYLGLTSWPMFWGFFMAIAEFFGGVLLILGVLFRTSVIILLLSSIITVAASIGQNVDFVHTANAIAITFVFLSMLFIGAGKYSLDRSVWKRRRRRA